MIVKVEISDGPYAMLVKHLADTFNPLTRNTIEEFIWCLIEREMECHPDYRRCSNPDCCQPILPEVTAIQEKHVPNPDYTYRFTTKAREFCHECGAPAGGVLEGIRAAGAHPFYVREIELRMAMRDVSERMKAEKGMSNIDLFFASLTRIFEHEPKSTAAH